MADGESAPKRARGEAEEEVADGVGDPVDLEAHFQREMERAGVADGAPVAASRVPLLLSAMGAAPSTELQRFALGALVGASAEALRNFLLEGGLRVLKRWLKAIGGAHEPDLTEAILTVLEQLPVETVDKKVLIEAKIGVDVHRVQERWKLDPDERLKGLADVAMRIIARWIAFTKSTALPATPAVSPVAMSATPAVPAMALTTAAASSAAAAARKRGREDPAEDERPPSPVRGFGELRDDTPPPIVPLSELGSPAPATVVTRVWTEGSSAGLDREDPRKYGQGAGLPEAYGTVRRGVLWNRYMRRAGGEEFVSGSQRRLSKGRAGVRFRPDDSLVAVCEFYRVHPPKRVTDPAYIEEDAEGLPAVAEDPTQNVRTDAEDHMIVRTSEGRMREVQEEAQGGIRALLTHHEEEDDDGNPIEVQLVRNLRPLHRHLSPPLVFHPRFIRGTQLTEEAFAQSRRIATEIRTQYLHPHLAPPGPVIDGRVWENFQPGFRTQEVPFFRVRDHAEPAPVGLLARPIAADGGGTRLGALGSGPAVDPSASVQNLLTSLGLNRGAATVPVPPTPLVPAAPAPTRRGFVDTGIGDTPSAPAPVSVTPLGPPAPLFGRMEDTSRPAPVAAPAPFSFTSSAYTSGSSSSSGPAFAPMGPPYSGPAMGGAGAPRPPPSAAGGSGGSGGGLSLRPEERPWWLRRPEDLQPINNTPRKALKCDFFNTILGCQRGADCVFVHDPDYIPRPPSNLHRLEGKVPKRGEAGFMDARSGGGGGGGGGGGSGGGSTRDEPASRNLLLRR